jgi:hypothetical protein
MCFPYPPWRHAVAAFEHTREIRRIEKTAAKGNLLNAQSTIRGEHIARMSKADRPDRGGNPLALFREKTIELGSGAVQGRRKFLRREIGISMLACDGKARCCKQSGRFWCEFPLTAERTADNAMSIAPCVATALSSSAMLEASEANWHRCDASKDVIPFNGSGRPPSLSSGASMTDAA